VLSSGYRPMAALMAVHALRALSWDILSSGSTNWL
jgi:hypothetical protein